jgi:MinD-like ATPase involved in chromosome partitioning or flagellar assembly
VVYALNRGIPFVLSNREAQVSQDIIRLATSIAGHQEATADDRKAAPRKSLFAWRQSERLPARGRKGSRRCPC